MLDIKLRQLNYSSMFDNSYSCKSFANMLEHLLHPYIHILQLIDCFKLALLYIFSKILQIVMSFWMHQFFICVIFIPGVQKIIYMIKHLRKLSYKIYIYSFDACILCIKGWELLFPLCLYTWTCFPSPGAKKTLQGQMGNFIKEYARKRNLILLLLVSITCTYL